MPAKSPEAKAKHREWMRLHRKTPAGKAARAAQAKRRKARQRAEGREFTEREAARAHAYYLAHREELLAEANAKRTASRAKEQETRKVYKAYALYKLTADQRATMLAARGPNCPTCGREKKPVVDHCHETGFVRGMICDGCNLAIGGAQDNPATLRALAAYLEETLTARLFS